MYSAELPYPKIYTMSYKAIQKRDQGCVLFTILIEASVFVSVTQKY